jgi:hypothetical protein
VKPVRPPKLVPDWRDSWRWWSVQAMTAAAALQGAWLAVPYDLKAHVPPPWPQLLTLGLLALGILGRLVDQPRPTSLDTGADDSPRRSPPEAP